MIHHDYLTLLRLQEFLNQHPRHTRASLSIENKHGSEIPASIEFFADDFERELTAALRRALAVDGVNDLEKIRREGLEPRSWNPTSRANPRAVPSAGP